MNSIYGRDFNSLKAWLKVCHVLVFFAFVLLYFASEEVRDIKTTADVDFWYSYTEPYNGAGTASDPFIIDTPQKLGMVQLNTKNGLHLSSYFKITKDLDLGEHVFYPIGFDGQFTGTIDGGYCVLMNVRMINGWCGIVERLNGGTIKNLGLSNVDVNHAYSGGYVGSICGYSEGNSTITNCFVYGGSIATKGNAIGGLVGYSENTTITNCYVNNVSLTMKPASTTTNVEYYRLHRAKGTLIETVTGFLYHFPVDFMAMKISTYDYSAFIGGLIGYETSATTTINNCYTNTSQNIINEYKTVQEKTISDVASTTTASSSSYNNYSLEKLKELILAREILRIESISEDACNSMIAGLSTTTTREGSVKIEKFGISPNVRSLNNSYYYLNEGTGAGSTSEENLKTLASTLGSEFSQSSHINSGFPFLKQFYWEHII